MEYVPSQRFVSYEFTDIPWLRYFNKTRWTTVGVLLCGAVFAEKCPEDIDDNWMFDRAYLHTWPHIPGWDIPLGGQTLKLSTNVLVGMSHPDVARFRRGEWMMRN